MSTRNVRLLGPVDYSLIELATRLSQAGELLYAYSGSPQQLLPPQPLRVSRGFVVLQLSLAANGSVSVVINGNSFLLNQGNTLVGGALYEFWVSTADGDELQVSSPSGIAWLRIFQR